MIAQPSFEVAPWSVREVGLDLDRLAQSESVFALANGHVGLRGNLDESEPYGVLGTYLNGVYEQRPLPYAEAGYGYPESGQTVVNVTDGKIIRLLVGDEPFDVRYGTLRSHVRTLDLRAGLLQREVEWCSPTGTAVRVTSTRLVSFAQRAIAAIEYTVEPLDGATRVVVQSELVSNEPGVAEGNDPRAGAALSHPLRTEYGESFGDAAVAVVHRTRQSGLRVGTAMDHFVEGPDGTEVNARTREDLGRVTVTADIEAGQRLRLHKFVAYGWSRERSLPAIHAQVTGALAEARATGWKGLVSLQRDTLDEFWNDADVEVDGDAEVQQAVRFALFHVLQAGLRSERRAIAGKGLTGPGYDGHSFWDSEMFVLPVLTYTVPHAAGDALRWRHTTLDQARERARQLGLGGAAFPWRTIHGEECSAYWPAGTAAFHINAGIADAVIRYESATGDDRFHRETGFELLVETARLWRSLGHHDIHGAFRIDGVTGPDEYSAIVDNNIYTNLMAQRNLRAAADAVERDPEWAARFDVDVEEAASWRDAAEAMTIPFDEDLGVHPQAEGFTRHERWDFDGTATDQYPLLLNFPYFQLYRKQVVKQADLVLALHLRGDAFTLEEKARDFAYYEALTVRDSSLSACTQAVVAAEVGHIELAYDYLGEAALMDLDDLEHNTQDGVHIASLAGTWTAIVSGLGGMRDHGERLAFGPRLPGALARISFRLMFKGRKLRVQATSAEATYLLREGDDLVVEHYGEQITLTAGAAVKRPIPAREPAEAPTQPRGRAPAHRAPSRRGGD